VVNMRSPWCCWISITSSNLMVPNGHAVGDMALVAVAKLLKEHLRTYDQVARLG